MSKSIDYRTYGNFEDVMCSDCINKGSGCNPLSCPKVTKKCKQICDLQGVNVRIGNFVFNPFGTTDDLIGLLPKEIGVPPCGSVLQIRFVEGMVRVSYGTSGDPAERYLCMNEDIHKALENMVILLQKQGEI